MSLLTDSDRVGSLLLSESDGSVDDLVTDDGE